MVIVENSPPSAGATSFTDLTLLSNDIPPAASGDDEHGLHVSDEDDDMLGYHHCSLTSLTTHN